MSQEPASLMQLCSLCILTLYCSDQTKKEFIIVLSIFFFFFHLGTLVWGQSVFKVFLPKGC